MITCMSEKPLPELLHGRDPKLVGTRHPEPRSAQTTTYIPVAALRLPLADDRSLHFWNDVYPSAHAHRKMKVVSFL